MACLRKSTCKHLRWSNSGRRCWYACISQAVPAPWPPDPPHPPAECSVRDPSQAVPPSLIPSLLCPCVSHFVWPDDGCTASPPFAQPLFSWNFLTPHSCNVPVRHVSWIPVVRPLLFYLSFLSCPMQGNVMTFFLIVSPHSSLWQHQNPHAEVESCSSPD